MNKEELEVYLHENIPLSQALGIKVDLASIQRVVLSASFAKNINHKKTVFGGSLHAVATLACWSLLYLNLQNLKAFDLVITRSTIDYFRPVTADFRAQCEIPNEINWHRFLSTLSLKDKGRIRLQATIHQDEKLAVGYEGTFAAIKRL